MHDTTILAFPNLMQIFSPSLSLSRGKNIKKKKKKSAITVARLRLREKFSKSGERERKKGRKKYVARRDVFLKSRNMQSYFRALENRASSIYMELLRRVDGT